MKTFLSPFVCAIALMFHYEARGIELLQVDHFTAGTAGWKVGGGGPGIVGPMSLDADGVDGPFLNYTTDNVNTGGRFLIMNSSQWTGDYLSAGITGISATARNEGDTDLDMRLLLEGPGGLFLSTNSLSLPSNSPWQSLFFPISSGHMTGGDDFLQTLADVTQIRIFHNPEPSFPGPKTIASMSIDNIQAIPEPQTWYFMWWAAAVILVHARSARRPQHPRILPERSECLG